VVPQIDVRPYDVADRAELIDGMAAAGEGAPGSEVWGHQPSLVDVYLAPYLDLEPESAFVAVVDGRIVGYLVGCVDGTSLPSEEERITASIRRHRLWRMPGPRRFFARAAYDTVVCKLRRESTAGELIDPRWPSHLHIDLMRAGRGNGAADALMQAWFARVREAGSPGCYLQTSVENTRAVRFFRRMGFVEHGPTPVIPGSRYAGGRMHQQTMVHGSRGPRS
jgi:ribosomal protein S18 acetylase RimI-like enzyme